VGNVGNARDHCWLALLKAPYANTLHAIFDNAAQGKAQAVPFL